MDNYHSPIHVVEGIHTSHMLGLHIDGLVQERRNSSALAMELGLSCTNLSILNIGLWV